MTFSGGGFDVTCVETIVYSGQSSLSVVHILFRNGLKQKVALSLFLFNLASEYASRKFQ